MSAFVAVFAREFRLRLLLLFGALIGGLAALIVPRIAGRTGSFAEETALDAALLVGLITGVLFSALLGAGAVAGDLTNGRLGFDFVRPISAWAIWAGRFGAAVALLLTSTALVLLPAILAGGRLSTASGFSPIPIGNPVGSLGILGIVGVGLLGCVALLFLVHAIGVFYAARSARLAIDLAALVATGLIAEIALTRLGRHWAFEAQAMEVVALIGLAVIALIAGSCAQVIRGRTDLARGHRALSVVLWGVLLVGTLGLEAVSRWVVSTEVTDLASAMPVQVAPRGSWFALSGVARNRGGDHRAEFLIDAASGRTVRTGSTAGRGWPLASFSADGKTAVSLLQEPGQSPSLARIDLTRKNPRPEALRVGLPALLRSFDLSPTGRWCAAVGEERLLVFELATSRLVAAVPLASPSVYEGVQLFWAEPDRLRLYSKRPTDGASDTPSAARIEIDEMTLPSGQMKRMGEIRTVPLGFPWEVSPDGSTVLVRDRFQGRRLLFGGLTGVFLSALEAPRQSSAFLLPHGWVAVVLRGPEGTDARTFVLYGREAQEIRRFDLPRYKYLRHGGLATPGILLAAGSSGNTEDPASWHLLALDLAAHKVTEIGRGVPALWSQGEPGSLGNRLVQTGEASFAVWDPATGKLVPLKLRPAG